MQRSSCPYPLLTSLIPAQVCAVLGVGTCVIRLEARHMSEQSDNTYLEGKAGGKLPFLFMQEQLFFLFLMSAEEQRDLWICKSIALSMGEVSWRLSEQGSRHHIESLCAGLMDCVCWFWWAAVCAGLVARGISSARLWVSCKQPQRGCVEQRGVPH